MDFFWNYCIIFVAKSIRSYEIEGKKDKSLSDYYLIGTLLSITFAVVIGIIINTSTREYMMVEQ